MKGRKGSPPKSMDPGISPLGAAGPRQPDPEFSLLCQHRRPGNGRAGPWGQDGIRASRGAGQGWTDSRTPGERPGWAQEDEKEPGSSRNCGVQQEKMKVGSSPGGIQPHGKDFWDQPGVPGQARNGNVPKCAEVAGKAPELLAQLETSRNVGGGKNQQEKLAVGSTPREMQALGDEPGVPHQARNGNVPREGGDQPRAPLRAGSSEDEEGESRESTEPPAAAARPGAEPREWVCERLRQLGQDMEEWEGKSTAELAAGLAQRIAGTPVESYPAEPGAWSARREQRPTASPEHGAPDGIYGSLLGMLRISGSAESGEDEQEEEEQEEEEEEEDSSSDSAMDVASDSDSDSEQEQEQEQEPAIFIGYVHQLQGLGSLAEEFPGVWARSSVECGRLEQEERLDGAPVPSRGPRPQPPHRQRRMAELLRQYLREGIVEEADPSDPLILNPLILKKKPKGHGWFLSVDCKALKATTPVGRQESLKVERILTSINPHSRFFSVLDLSNACLAIPLARSSRPRFAFTFWGRPFQFTRLPPTFHATSSILQRRVATMLGQLQPGTALGVLHYKDDILITGKSRQQAENRTRQVLKLIQSTGFKANPRKAQLVQRQVIYLGASIGAAGRGIPEEKLWEIRRDCEAAGRWNPKRLRSILGKFLALQEFIPDCSELMLPLQRLLKPGKREGEWEWGQEQRQQLQRLLSALEDAQVLPFLRKSQPFLIQLSLHQETFGATLLQERAGILRPVTRHSRRLRGRNLSPVDAWLQAAVRAVQAFQTLTGQGPLVIQDPNGNYLLRGRAFVTSSSWRPEPLLPEQWTLLVASRGPEPQESGTVAIPRAPPLGQLPSHVPRANVWFLAVEKVLSGAASIGFAAASLGGRSMQGVSGSAEDEEEVELEALREILEQHRSRSPLFLYCNRPGLAERLERRARGWNSGGAAGLTVLQWLRAFPGILSIREVGTAGNADLQERERIEKMTSSCRVLGHITRSSWIIWTPSSWEKQEIVAQCHRWHEGVKQTLARVWEVQCFGIDCQLVARWVLRCPTCRESNSNPHPDPDPNPDPDPDLDPDADPGTDPGAAPQRAQGPWSCLRISLSQALPKTPEGFQVLLVVQDALSGWLDAFPLRQSQETEVSQILLREVFGRFGKVRSVLLAPAPAWMWNSLNQAPLRNFWSSLERSEPHAAAACVAKAAQAAGKGWAEILPLILAGARSRWIEAEELRPLLCIPGLPLELRRECPEARPVQQSELGRLRGMLLLPGFRERVEAALNSQLRSEPQTGILRVRDWGQPDPGSKYARSTVGIRWIRDWDEVDLGSWGAGSGIGMGWVPAPP